MDFLVLEAEGLPDLEGARRVYGLATELPDDAAGRVLFHQHLQTHGQCSCIDPHLKVVAALAVVQCRDDRIRIWRYSQADTSEAGMLAELQQRIGQGPQTRVLWDGGRSLDSWLGLRCLIRNVIRAKAEFVTLDGLLGLTDPRIARCALAGRLEIPCEGLPSDESGWRAFRSHGISPVVDRCALNAVATARLFLRHELVGGRLAEDEYMDYEAQLTPPAATAATAASVS